ncbi:prepilin-type N-terminal cleavage/methylation domain-containing protein [Variovorax sp. J22P168]|uniref:PulJ/GspJ family protein n=1 Tax=Variovorax jilinensis TaxID=3053513 RepID=UPI00257700BF|nr:prepilin-type N-terminal cleavage/methylation domain-containing protein [Variovorax sp. J22P168]MDM0011335.1 prepilin-type N-terminal cleavage/methylation domain-containing protein [Variovorax sp. J22P168]
MTFRRPRGFTLIELMVAIAAMALLALMSWRGLDAMARAQSMNRERGDAVLTLQTTLAQWGADLDAVLVLPQITPIDWDGRVLRLTRRSTDSASPLAFVVAWTLRPDPSGGTHWRRWQSPGFTTRGEWQQAWNQAASWGSDGGADAAADVDLIALDGWQLGYFRNGAWGPALNTEAMGTIAPMPEGVRLVLSLPPGPALSGLVTRDWVRPTVTVPKT